MPPVGGAALVYRRGVTSPAAPLTIVSPRRALVVLGVVCVVFAAMGVVVFAISPGTTLNAIVGVGAFGFFGIGGGVAFVNQWRRSVVLRVDDAGIRLSSKTTIPWRDVDRIGSTSELLGIRLRRYDALTASPRSGHTADELKAARRSTGWDLSWAARLLDRTPAEAAAAVQRRMPPS